MQIQILEILKGLGMSGIFSEFLHFAIKDLESKLTFFSKFKQLAYSGFHYFYFSNKFLLLLILEKVANLGIYFPSCGDF